MSYAIGAIVVVALVWAIAKAASSDRYSRMTEEEFEAEAQRSSRLGGTVAVLQKILDPSHRVEYVQEQRERAEADGAESGDRPETASASPPKR